MSTSTKIILITPDELNEAFNTANLPIIERLVAIEKRLAQEKLFYSVKEVAVMLSVSPRTISGWISVGKEDKNYVNHQLKAKELVRGRYVINLTDLKVFLNYF